MGCVRASTMTLPAKLLPTCVRHSGYRTASVGGCCAPPRKSSIRRTVSTRNAVSSTALPAPRDAVVPNLATLPHARLARIAESRVILLTMLAAVAYVGWHLGRGWLAVDDGTLGHTAERVLLGELPHRDFDDVYTGGLAYLNAAAFRLVGTTLWTLRLVLLAFFVAWVPTVYYLARRFVRPLAASALTLVAVVWSVPSYPAAMPSWYNLFFATFGVAAF